MKRRRAGILWISLILLLAALFLLTACDIARVLLDGNGSYENNPGGKSYHHLYRADLDGRNRIDIVKEQVSAFETDGTRIVYQRSMDQFLYSVAADGSGKVPLTDTSVGPRFVLLDGTVYYSGPAGLGLSRVSVDGSDRREVCHDIGQDYRFADGWIYFITLGRNGIFRMKPDGSGNAQVVGDIGDGRQIESFLVADGWVYFFGYDKPGGLCRMKPDGTQAASIATNTTKLPSPGDFLDLVVLPDRIFYRGAENVLYRANPDGTGQSALGSATGWHLTVTDDWVYYLDANRLHRVKQDGTKSTDLPIQSSIGYRIAGGSIYYVNLSAES